MTRFDFDIFSGQILLSTIIIIIIIIIIHVIYAVSFLCNSFSLSEGSFSLFFLLFFFFGALNLITLLSLLVRSVVPYLKVCTPTYGKVPYHHYCTLLWV